MFNKDHIYGSMVYLSSAFISQPSNMKIIQQKHYGIMAYRSNQATNPVPFDINKVDQTNGYNWFRPLNMIFSIVMNKEAVMNFLSGILNDEQTMLAIGAKPLSNTEKSTMGMLATSDVEIVKQTNPG
jgi:hypothetical protein